MPKYQVSYGCNESPRPTITKGDKQLSIEEAAEELNKLRKGVKAGWLIILHEVDNQRTPERLKDFNGLGYFEKLLR